jgi:phosphoribosyl 1,2-cyclic phosphodiesterase
MDDTAATPEKPSAGPAPIAALRVLASGSSGNCSVLLLRVGGERRLCLIDAGLSPRRVRKLLEHTGLSMDLIDCVLVTHLDHDHWQPAWCDSRGLPSHACVRLHTRHAAAARRAGVVHERIRAFDGPFELYPGINVAPTLGSHDEMGVSSFRLEFIADDPAGGPELAASLGFATDLGHMSDSLIDHFRAVDVMAIESNYCPRMQQESSRPWFLKKRIMGGAGHLSNEQCLRAVESIGPRSHVVLLHLSRECNHPDLVAEMHAGADYAVTITHQERASRWIPIYPSPRRREPLRAAPTPQAQLGLFSNLGAVSVGAPHG